MEVTFKDVVALTGTPGLHRIVKSDDKALVVESLDERKRRQLIKGNMMVSKLSDISIYTDEDSEPLVSVMHAISEKYGETLPVSKKSANGDLMNFLGEVLPTFDRDRVYPSNVKKLISWYHILLGLGIAFEVPEEAEGDSEAEAATEKEAKK